MDRLEKLQGEEESIGNVPSLLFIEQGATAARGNTTWNKSDGIVEIEDLTIKGGERSGLYAFNGMNVIMRTERTSPATTSKWLVVVRVKCMRTTMPLLC